MEKVNNGTPLGIVKRSPKAKKSEFVRVFDDLTAVWGGPAWEHFVRDMENSADR